MALAKDSEHALQTCADQDIHNSKEYSRQRGHDEHHNSGQQNLTAGWPDDFCGFCPDLLDKR